jgi:hypothetical protein
MRLLFFLLLCSSATLTAQKYPLLIAHENTPADQRAAIILHAYLEKITRQPVSIAPATRKNLHKYTFYVGRQPKAMAGFGIQIPDSIPDDAFFLQGQNDVFCIAGGGDMGPEYGVYTLLEKIGCRKFSPRDSFIPELPDLRPPLCPPTLEKPAFPYRELWYEPATDEAWARWHKVKTRPEKQEEWGLFVHTFDRLCPSKTYFDTHPEYFAWNGARRSPGQLCLTNDSVLHIVVEQLRREMAQKPEARYWSVSQNDNFDYCKCNRCAASDKRLGGPAGTLLAFVNRIAVFFPDKIISTLAYQYTRRAPKNIQPAPNVSVCLCSIECGRGSSLESGCPDFARDVAEWSAICRQLMIWDYVVQFRSYVSPFPNWQVLQPNLQMMQRHGVKMVFEQGSGADRSEFSDMRAYVLAKLMWNPQVNMDSVLLDFGRGYYGAARPIIWDYIHLMTENVQKGKLSVDIYGTPQMEMKSFLHPEMLEKYLGVFRRGRLALSDDSTALSRLDEASLPLRYALMELGKTGKANTIVSSWLRVDVDRCKRGMNLLNYGLWEYEFDKGYRNHCNIVDFLQKFVDDCALFGYRNLHEMGYTPQQYQHDILQFLSTGLKDHVARYSEPQFQYPPSTQYEAGKGTILTDALCGTDDYHFNWLGFEGKDLVATFDFKAPLLINSLETHFLQDQQAWVFLPVRVAFEVSDDGIQWQTIYSQDIAAAAGPREVRTIRAQPEAPLRARYLRVRGESLKKCPEWHSCNGNNCWIFVDEVVVR